MDILNEAILPACNLFCYGQVDSPYGSGDYIKSLGKVFGSDHEKMILSEIANRDGIYESIRTFLGTGK